MNRYSFVLFVSLFSISAVSAQDDLVDLLAEKACACAAKKDLSNLSQDEISMELSMCMMSSLSESADKLAQLDVDMTDQASMNKLGEQIGMRMAGKCPETLMKIGQMQVEQKQPAATPASGEMTGTIRRLEGDDFSFLILADAQGREHRFLWLRYFPGSERLVNDPAKAVGQRVTLQFTELECYSPQAKDYFKRREIKSIKF